MKNKLIIGVALITTLNSCIKTIELETKDKTSKLVVNSVFESGKSWNVRVSKSLSVLDKGNLDDIKNATVTITEEGGPTYSLQHFVGGEYKPLGLTPGIPINKKFRIKVSAPGFEDVTSENFCPQKTLISSTSYTDKRNNFDLDAINREFKFVIQDRAGENNFYVLEYVAALCKIDTNNISGQIDTTLVSDGVSYVESVHPFVDASRSSYATPVITFSDKLFNGKLQELTFRSYIYQDVFTSNYIINKINLYTVSEETYFYYRSMNSYIKAADNPFAEPVQVFSNIKNGFGVFGGKTKSEYVF